MVDIYSLATTIGGSFGIGLIIGFISKKLVNVFAFIIGIQIALFAYLDYINVIDINWELFMKIRDTIYEIIFALRFPENVETTELYMSSGIIGSFIVGLFIGFFYL